MAVNVFSSFSFGRLIKTFVPGFVLLAALILVFDGVLLLRHKPAVLDLMEAHDSTALWTAAIILCLILGLLSNTIVFCGVNDLFVRNPVARDSNNKATFDARNALDRLIKTRFIAKIEAHSRLLPKEPGSAAALDARAFATVLDSEYLALRTIGVETLVHVQEQYWYYMELHINLAMTIVLFASASIFRLFVVDSSPCWWLPWHIIPPALVAGFMVLMARKNYLRHMNKMCSLLCSFVAMG